MTCIAAIQAAGGSVITIGADSLATDCCGAKFPASVAKWKTGKRWAVGVTGQLRGMNLVQMLGTQGDTPTVGGIVQAIKGLMAQDGWDLSASFGGPANVWNGFLIVTPEGIHDVGNDFGVTKVPPGVLWAKGSGGVWGAGAAFGAGKARQAITDRERIRIAIEAAIRFDTSCGGPVYIAEVETKE